MEVSCPNLQHMYSEELVQDYFLLAHHCTVNINFHLSALSSHHYKGDIINN